MSYFVFKTIHPAKVYYSSPDYSFAVDQFARFVPPLISLIPSVREPRTTDFQSDVP